MFIFQISDFSLGSGQEETVQHMETIIISQFIMFWGPEIMMNTKEKQGMAISVLFCILMQDMVDSSF